MLAEAIRRLDSFRVCGTGTALAGTRGFQVVGATRRACRKVRIDRDFSLRCVLDPPGRAYSTLEWPGQSHFERAILCHWMPRGRGRTCQEEGHVIHTVRAQAAPGCRRRDWKRSRIVRLHCVWIFCCGYRTLILSGGKPISL